MSWVLGRFQCVDDGARIAAFEPAVSGHRAVARAVRTSIHHYNVVAGGQQHKSVFEHAHAIVGDAVKQQNPVAAGVR